MINLSDTYGAVAAAEEAVDISAFAIEDVDVWVHCREILLQPFVNLRLNAYRSLVGPDHQPDPFRWQAKRSWPVRPASLQPSHRRARMLVATPHDMEPVNPDVLIWSVFTDYQDVSRCGVFARLTDGLRALVDDEWTVASFVRAIPSSLAAPFHHPHHLVFMLDPDARSRPIPGEESLMDACRDLSRWAGREGYEYALDVPAFSRRLRELWWRIEHLTDLIGAIRPHLVVISSYSNWERSAVVAAANRLGVETIDIEHGFWGPFSPYGALRYLPATGSLSVPKVFWTWGSWQQNALQRVLGPHQDTHRTIVGGNPWRVAAPLLKGDGREEARVHAPLRASRRGQVVVLLAWQPDMLVHEPGGRLLPRALTDLDSSIRCNLMLCLRLHPRQRHLTALFERALSAAGFENWDVTESTHASLGELLRCADLLLTSYSTVAFEANEQGVPVGIVDKFGTRMCSELIENGYFHDVATPERLGEALRSRVQLSAERIDYCAPDPELPASTLRALLNGCREGTV